jgi:hypothetical protein
MKTVLWATVLSLFLVSPSWAQPTCEEAAAVYVPQSSPEASYRLELEMMKQGFYCHNVPLFDPRWRARGHTISFAPIYRQTAQTFDKPFKVYVEGKLAVIYYPHDKHLGPAFAYREGAGWVLDRTTVMEKIHYGNEWTADEGDYPYLGLLKKIFSMQKGRSSRGVNVYRPARKSPP